MRCVEIVQAVRQWRLRFETRDVCRLERRTRGIRVGSIEAIVYNRCKSSQDMENWITHMRIALWASCRKLVSPRGVIACRF